jgi:hypothetical protein
MSTARNTADVTRENLLNLFTVVFTACSANRTEKSVRVRATDKQDAISRGVKKAYGRSRGWWPDSGLPGYGQVIEPAKGSGSSCVTGRVRVEVA